MAPVHEVSSSSLLIWRVVITHVWTVICVMGSGVRGTYLWFIGRLCKGVVLGDDG